VRRPAARAHVIGALNLFRGSDEPFTGTEMEIAQATAEMAAIGLIQERALRERNLLTEQLQAALNSRVVIEQAKGMLAEYLTITLDDAFTLLRNHARDHNRKLSEVATEVVYRKIPALRCPPTQPREITGKGRWRHRRLISGRLRPSRRTREPGPTPRWGTLVPGLPAAAPRSPGRRGGGLRCARRGGLAAKTQLSQDIDQGKVVPPASRTPDRSGPGHNRRHAPAGRAAAATGASLRRPRS
jgi:ANTAR domain